VDMYSGETMAMLDREGNGMSDLVFGAGGTRLAALSNDRILSIWDTTTYELLDSRQLNQVSPNNVAYDPTGHYLAILEWFVSPKIAVWDISDPANPGDIQVLIEDIETPGISLGNKIVFSPNGSLLAAINGADIIVWETATWNQLGVIDGHKYAVTSLDFNYDGMLLASGSEDRTVRIWHMPSLTEIAVLGSPEENGQIAEVYFNPARDILAARFDNKISLWSLDIPSSQTAPDVIPLPTQISAPDPVITCPIHANEAVNLREGPGTTFAVSGALEAGLTAIVDGQTTDDEGFIWWHLARGVWVRADVVEALGDCENVPYLPDE
jgi:WD40 repeat protein